MGVIERNPQQMRVIETAHPTLFRIKYLMAEEVNAEEPCRSGTAVAADS
jgi:hypothetical protein